jgi:mannose-6-phosphate isomerase-like protein (cupin superfamily)
MIRAADTMRTEIRPNLRGGPGTVTIIHGAEKEDFGSKTRLCATLVLPPGAGIGPHPHEGEDEIYLVLRGRGIVEEDGVGRPVGPGDVAVIGRGRTHALTNDGRDPLEVFAVITCY